MNAMLQTIESAAPSIAMLGAFACLAGGAWQIAKGRNRRKGALLLVMAAVLIGNVMVLTI